MDNQPAHLIDYVNDLHIITGPNGACRCGEDGITCSERLRQVSHEIGDALLGANLGSTLKATPTPTPVCPNCGRPDDTSHWLNSFDGYICQPAPSPAPAETPTPRTSLDPTNPANICPKCHKLHVGCLCATHRCKICGALWQLNPPTKEQPQGSWTLFNNNPCGKCCDNEPMLDQIEELPDGYARVVSLCAELGQTKGELELVNVALADATAEVARWKELANLKDAKGESNRTENNNLRAQLAAAQKDAEQWKKWAETARDTVAVLTTSKGKAELAVDLATANATIAELRDTLALKNAGGNCAGDLLKAQGDDIATLRAALSGVLASATPHRTEHPTMFAAWERGHAALAGQGAEGRSENTWTKNSLCMRCERPPGECRCLASDFQASPAVSPQLLAADDTKRLDWLETHLISLFDGGGAYGIEFGSISEPQKLDGMPSVRAAIDAATQTNK